MKRHALVFGLAGGLLIAGGALTAAHCDQRKRSRPEWDGSVPRPDGINSC